MRLRVPALALVTSGAALALPPFGRPQLSAADHHDVSAPLWLLRPAGPDAPLLEREPGRIPLPLLAGPTRDPVLQDRLPALLAQPILGSFDGIGDGFVGASGGAGFHIIGNPPDPQGDVGPNHYVQIVNSSFAVFSKTGTVIFGPVPTRTVFAGFGGPCEKSDAGDGIVLYDPLADRWIVTQIAMADRTAGPFYECIAVSRGPDPTGPYAQYAYAYSLLNDYPKLGVWPDGYYATYNMLQDGNDGAPVVKVTFCAFDRVRMLSASPAPQQCVDVTPGEVSGTTPADFDGALAPPPGEPETIVGFFGKDTLVLYRYHVDWTDPANSQLDAVELAVAPFQRACAGSRIGACVPQSGNLSPPLDALSDRMMYRATYRNFGGYEALVANHTVTAAASTGVRWYEIRDPAGDPTVYQQGTYGPDSNWRWMGSAAMDRAGNIGLGFSLSSANQHPAVGVTSHAITDPPGVMGQGEATFAGGGSQAVSVRWGDYSSLSVDPSDDCTFWYTGEYIPSDGVLNWRTHVLTFQVTGCTGAPDFAVWVSPRRGTLRRPGSATMSVATGALHPRAAGKTLQLTLSPMPAGVVATPTPFPPLTVGQTAVLTITADASAAVGEIPFAVSAAAPDGMTVSGTAVAAVIDSDFTLALDRRDTAVGAGGRTDLRVQTAPSFGPLETVAFSVAHMPRGVSAVFDPPSARVGESATLHLTGDQTMLAGTTNAHIVATGALASHAAILQIRALTLPFAKILSPPPRSFLSGVTKVAAAAAASVGTKLSRIDLYVDDSRIARSTAGSPTEMTWNTATVDDGPHILTARAVDVDGNQGSSAPVAVWIQNTNACGCSSDAGGWEALALFGLLAAIRRRKQ